MVPVRGAALESTVRVVTEQADKSVTSAAVKMSLYMLFLC